MSRRGRCTSPGCTRWLTPCLSFYVLSVPSLLSSPWLVVGWCTACALLYSFPLPSAYLCPLFISLISLLSTFLEPSALPPHSLQCSEVDTEGKHTLNLQWPGSPSAQCASSSSSAYSKPQLASPAHILWSSLYISASAPLPYPQITSFPDRRSSGTPVPGPRLGLQHIHHGA